MRTIMMNLAAVMLLSACVPNIQPTALGDQRLAQPYGYQPLDPLPVRVTVPNDALPMPTASETLAALGDETIRIAIGQIDQSGGITYGAGSIGANGSRYVVTLDYAKFVTNPLSINVQRQLDTGAPTQPTPAVVPVYIGVGLRLTAQIYVTGAKVDLGSLAAIGAAAERKEITGTLVVQTLGVSGPSVSAVIPMPSEISTSSIQNAILALGVIKSKLYDRETVVFPRVLAVYNNIGGGPETINEFITQVLREQMKIEYNSTEKMLIPAPLITAPTVNISTPLQSLDLRNQQRRLANLGSSQQATSDSSGSSVMIPAENGSSVMR